MKKILALLLAIPIFAADPSGTLQISWDYPTNALAAPYGVDTNWVFKFYGSPDITLPTKQWTFLSKVYAYNSITSTNGTNYTLTTKLTIPNGKYFIAGTSSNFWAESFFSPALYLPALPVQGSNLRAWKVESPDIVIGDWTPIPFENGFPPTP